jgi:hypothetical protein
VKRNFECIHQYPHKLSIPDDTKGMIIEQPYQKEIEEIMSGMKCSKEFICYTSGFKRLCNAKDIGIEAYVECFEKILPYCSFAFPFASVYLCKCPMRVFIAKKFNK